MSSSVKVMAIGVLSRLVSSEASEDLKPALTGNKTMQYVPNSHDVKMALEIYKLTLEVELLQLQIQKEKHTEAH